MAVAPTGAIYKTLTFDGASSASFGVYITGEAVFNAPEREVEMITVPGRNGAYALDKGRFENITVTYPAGIFADTDADFSEAISDFRNWLCSREGYVRLEDDYHPDEYRLAVYKNGLEVEPAKLNAGEFKIVFECKPQRFLKSGEDEITVESGDLVPNPTRFDASPLLSIYGYGTINIGDYTIVREHKDLGNITIGQSLLSAALPAMIQINTEFLNTGDTITVPSLKIEEGQGLQGGAIRFLGVSVTSTSNATATASGDSSHRVLTIQASPDVTFSYGTASTVTLSAVFDVYVFRMSGSAEFALTVTVSVAYDGDHTITVSASDSSTTYLLQDSATVTTDTIKAYSTKDLSPVYVDLEFGEAWAVQSGARVSANNVMSLGSKLPVLKPGETEITFDNTIESLEVTPRWWIV